MDSLSWIHADDQLTELRQLTLIDEADMQVDIRKNAEVIDNSWSITLPERIWNEQPILEGHYIYAPGTEWGGPVTTIKHNTGTQRVTIQGPTWRGLLHQRRIYPPAGQGYLVIEPEDANYLIGDIIGQSLGGIFVYSGELTGVDVGGAFRYQTYAAAIQSTLADAGLTLRIRFDQTLRACVLDAQPVTSLSDVEVSQDYGVNFTSQIGSIDAANHCLALGSGELADRMVLNLYRVGDVYYTERPQELPVEDLRTVLLDYSSAEDADELLKSARERLEATAPAQQITINEVLLQVDAALGDRLLVRDRVTGLAADSEVRQKILTIKQGVTAIDMQIGVLTIKRAE